MPVTMSLVAGVEFASSPTVPLAAQVTCGALWSPKLVKVNGARPDGAVRKTIGPWLYWSFARETAMSGTAL